MIADYLYLISSIFYLLLTIYYNMYNSGNQLIDPQLLFEKAQLRKNMYIADFGCGRTGHIIFPAAKIIGEHGIIYAIDIMKDILENIIKRAHMHGMTNVHTIWSDLEMIGKTSIPEKSLDVVFMTNSLFHMKNKINVLIEASRLLKDKSRLIIVDWIENNLTIGPKGDKLVDFSQIKSWAQSNNFTVQEEFPVGTYHIGVVLYKNT